MVLRVVTKFFGCVTFMLYNIFSKTYGAQNEALLEVVGVIL